MMRAKLCFTLSLALRAAAGLAIGAGFLAVPGCGLMNKSSSPPSDTETLPASPEAAAVANSQNQQPSTDKDDDKELKCDQLVRNPPGIEEIRRTPQLGIESREIRVERTADIIVGWYIAREEALPMVGARKTVSTSSTSTRRCSSCCRTRSHSISHMRRWLRKRRRTASR